MKSTMADNQPQPISQNKLETLLEQAATEPAWRPAFFRELLDASVWVPGSSPGDAVITADSVVDLQHWEKEDGTSVIPFFTSVQALEQVVEHEQAFIVMPARVLFEMTLGETLFLNARLPTGKEFLPGEIRHLLSEQGSPLAEHTVLEGGSQLQLSAVENPPAQLVESLTTLFKNHNRVKRAFLCTLKESPEEAGNYLIGIEAEGDIEPLIYEAGNVAADTLTGDEPVDICLVAEGEAGISHFMLAHLTPFYERRWGSFLRDLKTQRIL